MGLLAFRCGISGLPIEMGDRVMFMLLTRNPMNIIPHRACVATDLWFPRTYPVRSEYNGDGLVKNIENMDQIKTWLDVLNTDLITVGEGKNNICDVATYKDMKFDDFLWALWNGRIVVREKDGILPLQVSYVLIREDVWNLLVSMGQEFYFPEVPLVVGRKEHYDQMMKKDNIDSFLQIAQETRKVEDILFKIGHVWIPSCLYGEPSRKHKQVLEEFSKLIIGEKNGL